MRCCGHKNAKVLSKSNLQFETKSRHTKENVMQNGQTKNLNDIVSTDGAIKEIQWCCGTKRVTVKAEDTK